MGIDKLNAIARAAGFAMAVSDEFMTQPAPQRSVDTRDAESPSVNSSSTALVVRPAKPQANWATWGMGWSFWRTA